MSAKEVSPKKDHIRLRDALIGIQGKFLLSYNDDEFIRELYDAPGIQILSTTRINNIKQRYDPNSQFAELLIGNYDLAERARMRTESDDPFRLWAENRK
jgi:DNA adenine methylase